MLSWFVGNDERVVKRGGSGYGITTTASSVASYGQGPPSSTLSRWHGIGKGPEIAGSTGGFIGLLSGLAIFILIAVIAGIYVYNRYRKRIPPKSSNSFISGIFSRQNPIVPTLFLSRPSTDPYAQGPSALELNETPKASNFGYAFTRPVYTRQRSSDWDLVFDGSPSPNAQRSEWSRESMEIDLPDEPGEAAWPIRSIHHRSVSPSHSASSSRSTSSTQREREREQEYREYKGKGKALPDDRYDPSFSRSNPFEHPYYAADSSNFSARDGQNSRGREPLLKTDSGGAYDSADMELPEEKTPRIPQHDEQSSV
ncbi:hypothetical protein C343_05925 [Cryptococcus neoformans C23]|uniref:Uncharacterized protein n=2 Tax=Cryptococcus neoformans TaxID=5207 RepID=A0A854Q6R6_CRYNE|nr:hypothetical protein CNAG_01571 [Cryptococcus neoformans var. grubii H99]OWZ27540.1 hypothetical protein C347_05964 [Cryptococcus neoformans var. grubii AD2-60a]OWZ32655.1 hypothetical protein C353_05825 [Cryptococcus neoformans var. grubii AD1-83a]OWZ39844.1 hypothetical protein C343_05925 [Cryptococcus neoformans var. grubii C23]OWZ50923.1 hypothetical protein C368_06079 [Cryptococcus neoformans var. grubii 125.91]OXC82084.1 hypothetical protein C344_05644 [Cryptococcus neoformans var. gr|eukprot:XP_012052609.1 hypothetical protein CNAG_01571 [Cryptococcus neoformans var. grubii H99]